MVTQPAHSMRDVLDITAYPQSGNRPMASTQHQRAQRTLALLLEDIVPVADVVGEELMIVLDSVDMRRNLTPDVFLARGVGELDPIFGVLRRQYRLWHEGKVPDLVYEGASPSTYLRDSVGKKADYAALGVREYVQFDPTGGMLTPRLQVFRLGASGRYERVMPHADGSVRCVTLPDYDWVVGGYLLRLRERATGLLVPTQKEQARAEAAQAEREAARADAEAMRAEVEAARAEAETMRAEVEAARAEAETMRAEVEAARADAETMRAEAEATRAETEAERADAAEAENARLRTQLARLREEPPLA